MYIIHTDIVQRSLEFPGGGGTIPASAPHPPPSSYIQIGRVYHGATQQYISSFFVCFFFPFYTPLALKLSRDTESRNIYVSRIQIYELAAYVRDPHIAVPHLRQRIATERNGRCKLPSHTCGSQGSQKLDDDLSSCARELSGTVNGFLERPFTSTRRRNLDQGQGYGRVYSYVEIKQSRV